ncbi:U-box domain-containing protein 9-like [Gastrolobium bilobum]|uniref:U-box domain-containing protein 9-like n=1 Tax=Gastrolobium bilobum TaxID=150636 RepID=UPI002AB0D69C|nr:U-box domain-containing protein 9-like [Gastrolobium bilobum]
MAKPGVLESDPGVMVKKTLELKKELQRLVKSIVDDEDCSTETIDQAKETLCVLKELKLRQSSSLSLKLHKTVTCPDEFKCPLSMDLMRDPVIVASGQTYDKPFIQKWLNAGNRTCPQTHQVLSHTVLTPNHLIREMIEKWSKNQGTELSNTDHYINEEGINEADSDHFLCLLKKMSSALSDQKAAAKELRLLTKKHPCFRALFCDSVDAIPQLLKPVCGSDSFSSIHPDLQEDVITTLLNISIHDSNKKLVAETPMVIPLLMKALGSGTIETRSNAAATLFTLSALDSNKELIGKSGALKSLFDLLEEGHPLAMKDVASAIFTLCVMHENKARAVKDGAVRVILTKIKNRIHVDELLAILALLSTHQKAIQDMGELGAVPSLLSIIKESSCERNKENCIAILQTICLYDRSKLKEIKEEENTNRTISELAQNGTSRAKRKASGILERLNRVVNITHTA